ncbi:MAG: hypothetical protein SGCHY_001446, partial [Lobulomycetales sp.]
HKEIIRLKTLLPVHVDVGYSLYSIGLLILWAYMLWTTCLHFHGVGEKAVGVGLALAYDYFQEILIT